MAHYDEQRDALENSIAVAVVPRPSKPPIAMTPPIRAPTDRSRPSGLPHTSPDS